MANIERTFVLVGPYAGRTITLGKGLDFVLGKMRFTGPEVDADNIGRYLERCYNAHPEGPALDAARAAYDEAHPSKIAGQQEPPKEQSDEGEGGKDNGEPQEAPVGGGDAQVAPGAAGDGPSGGDGQEGADNGAPAGGPAEAVKPSGVEGDLATAVKSLNPEKDENWTGAGLPRMDAVEAVYGSAGITRADVEAAAPGWNREAARKAAADVLA